MGFYFKEGMMSKGCQEHKRFIRDHFEAHAALTARAILQQRAIGSTEEEQRNYIQSVVMGFLITAFAEEKIMVKSSVLWDWLENNWKEHKIKHGIYV